ncbi:MAG: tetratricopeptide repeat protein [Candidatus Woesearchaeota archaeon]|nr:MAG: tetratricopeptide repeat protein [Candidatus Woesearchaeota archaeon]
MKKTLLSTLLLAKLALGSLVPATSFEPQKASSLAKDLAHNHYMNNQYEEAIPLFEKAIEQAEATSSDSLDIAVLHGKLGYCFTKTGQVERATEADSIACTYGPSEALLFNNWANSLYEAGRTERSFEVASEGFRILQEQQRELELEASTPDSHLQKKMFQYEEAYLASTMASIQEQLYMTNGQPTHLQAARTNYQRAMELLQTTSRTPEDKQLLEKCKTKIEELKEK